MRGYLPRVLTEHGILLRLFMSISEVLPALLEELGFHFCLLMSLGEALQLQLNFFLFWRGEEKGWLNDLVSLTFNVTVSFSQKKRKNVVSYFPVYTSQVMTHLKKYWHFQAEVKVLQYCTIQWQTLAYLPSQVISFHEKCKFTFKNVQQKYVFSSTLLLTSCLRFQ